MLHVSVQDTDTTQHHANLVNLGKMEKSIVNEFTCLKAIGFWSMDTCGELKYCTIASGHIFLTLSHYTHKAPLYCDLESYT